MRYFDGVKVKKMLKKFTLFSILSVLTPISVVASESPYVPVAEIKDLENHSWEVQTLISLSDRYQCLPDNIDSQLARQESVTRYEFAELLSRCLNEISTDIEIKDLAALERLTQNFREELFALESQINSFDERINTLEEVVFSPTTKLFGRVNFVLAKAEGRKVFIPTREEEDLEIDDLEANTIFGYDTFLTFDTSFNGRDLLRTTLFAGNTSIFTGDVAADDFAAIGSTNTDNDLELGTAFYQIPLSRKGLIRFGPLGIFSGSIIPRLNPVLSPTRFGSGNPIYSLSSGGGVVMYYQLSDLFGAGISYLVNSSSLSNPQDSFGLFNGQYGLLTQITYTSLDERLGIGLTYARTYDPTPGITGGTGSLYAQAPFGQDTPTSANAFGIQGTYQVTLNLQIGGWVGYTTAKAQSDFSVDRFSARRGDSADIWNWAITANILDIGKAGSQLGFVFGMPPKIANNDVKERSDEDSGYHIEVSYRYLLTDRIFLTPVFLYTINPNHDGRNDDIWVLGLRATYDF